MDHFTSLIPEELKDVLQSTPDTLHGGVRFAGTRVYAYQLLEYIFAGRSVREFLDDFDGVTNEQVEAVLHWARAVLQRELPAAS